MESDNLTEIEYCGDFYYVEVETSTDNRQYKTYNSKWKVFDSEGYTVTKLRGEYSESKACDPFFIEDMIDSLMKVVRAKIFLYHHDIPDESDLDEEGYKEFLRYMHGEKC